MPDTTGFMRHDRALPPRRPVPVRIMDWREVYDHSDEDRIREQASRCMDCGIPFCHNGCPLGNRIPEWNDLVRNGRWEDASAQLHATNNFPEFTGRLCPAPCESACVLAIGDAPDAAAGSGAVTIKQIEVDIIDHAFADDTVTPLPPSDSTGKSVAVVGSGPAGLAAAQQLARAGHAVTVYERDDAPGGLLRYGIPDFKLEKHHIDRRIDQLKAEGVSFICDCEIGVNVTMAQLQRRHDAVLLAVGALESRDTDVPGRDLPGVHLAMDHLVAANRVVAGRAPFAAIDARDKHVVIIGGGDTAADCLGVAHRQGAASVTQMDLYPQPPRHRAGTDDPWPTWPTLLRDYPAHEEGGERVFAVAAAEFVPDEHGHVRHMSISEVSVDKSSGSRVITEVEGTRRLIPADLILLAIGFAGTEDQPLIKQSGIPIDKGVIDCGSDWQTDAEAVFVAGDAHRGASLIVWAIAEGRAAAAGIHRFLGGTTELPSPVEFDSQPLQARLCPFRIDRAAQPDPLKHYGVKVSQDPKDPIEGQVGDGTEPGGAAPDPNDRDDEDQHARAHRRDMEEAKQTLDRVRRERPFRTALWGFRLYYIGILASVGSLLVSCFDEESGAPMVVVPIGLPLGVVGYLFGYYQLRKELRAFMLAADKQIWHSRRDRKNMWQAAIFRDAFMGRLQ